MAIVEDHSHNLLIIEGKHSDQTRALSKILKDTFPEDNWYTITVDLANITEDLKRINDFHIANSIGRIIAFGQEAIFALAITNSVGKQQPVKSHQKPSSPQSRNNAPILRK